MCGVVRVLANSVVQCGRPQGCTWLCFGSFWTGIKLRRIDPATGKLSAADPTLYSLAARLLPRKPGRHAGMAGH